jgi:hypothetical protein
MRRPIEDLSWTQCAHQTWVDIDDGRGLRPLSIVPRNLLGEVRPLSEQFEGHAPGSARLESSR